nr:hypothetical protein Iba_chr11aCG14050 [Ipomoea batatas]
MLAGNRGRKPPLCCWEDDDAESSTLMPTTGEDCCCRLLCFAVGDKKLSSCCWGSHRVAAILLELAGRPAEREKKAERRERQEPSTLFELLYYIAGSRRVHLHGASLEREEG